MDLLRSLVQTVDEGCDIQLRSNLLVEQAAPLYQVKPG
jgi:hypothetical protein